MDGILSHVGSHAKDLGKLPVAGFIVSLAPVTKDPVDREYAQKALRASLTHLQPVVETVFAGRLDPTKLSWLQKLMVEKAKSPVGHFRDWTASQPGPGNCPGKWACEKLGPILTEKE